MKTLINTLLAALLVSAFISTASAQDWKLNQHIGGVGQDKIKDMATDAEGSTYYLIEFTSAIELGSQTISNSGRADVAIAKFSAANELVWVKTLASSGSDYGYGLSLQGSNLVASIAYSNNASFEGNTLTSTGYTDVLVAHFSTDGQLNWFKTAGSTGFDFPGDISFDNNGDVVLTGWFSAVITFSGYAVQTQSHNDVFLAKYLANGDFAWATSIGGSGSDVAYAIHVSKNNNYHIAGQFETEIGTLTDKKASNGSFDAYYAKFAPNGELLALNTFGSSQAETIYALQTDDEDNTYVAGYFAGAMSIDRTTVQPAAYDDGFIAKISSDNQLVWLQAVSGSGWEYVRDITLNEKQTKLYATGYFSGAITLNDETHVPAGGDYDYDMFVIECETEGGLVLDATTMGGANSDFAYKSMLTAASELVIGGEFYGSYAKDAIDLTSVGGSDALVVNKPVETFAPLSFVPEYSYSMDTLYVSISAANADELHYVSFEMDYPTAAFQLVQVNAGAQVHANSLFLSGELSEGKLGIAIGKTAPANYNATLVELTFVRNTYASIEETLYFSNVIVENAAMEAISPVQFPSSFDVMMSEVLSIYPGDADHNGTVNEVDVLSVSYYWNQAGLARPNASIVWEEQHNYAWTDADATYADTDGNGSINQNDMRAIIANYGKTNEVNSLQKRESNPEITESYVIAQMKKGETQTIELYAQADAELLGASFQVVLSEISSADFRVANVNLGSWADGWKSSNKLISFAKQQDNVIGVAAAVQGKTNKAQVYAQDLLISIEIEALTDWNGDATLSLNQLSIRSANGSVEQASDMIHFNMPTANEMDSVEKTYSSFELLGNYPNPFNPQTTLSFALPQASHVRIVVYNLLGQQVSELMNSTLQAGLHNVPFNAENLSSGTYVYNVIAGNEVKTATLSLVK